MPRPVIWPKARGLAVTYIVVWRAGGGLISDPIVQNGHVQGARLTQNVSANHPLVRDFRPWSANAARHAAGALIWAVYRTPLTTATFGIILLVLHEFLRTSISALCGWPLPAPFRLPFSCQ